MAMLCADDFSFIFANGRSVDFSCLFTILESQGRKHEEVYMYSFKNTVVAQHIHVQMGLREKCNDSKGQF